MLLNDLDKLGRDDITAVQLSTVLGKEGAIADGVDHAIKEEEGVSGGQRSAEHRKIDIMTLVVTKVPSFLDPSCTQASSAKLGESVRKPSTVLFVSRRRAPSAK